MKATRPFSHLDGPRMDLSERQQARAREFNQRVGAGQVEFEEIPCLCGSRDVDLVSEYERHGMRQDTVLCRRCGLLRSSPRMTAAEYGRFYASDSYRLCYEGENYLEIYEKEKYRPETGAHIFEEVVKVTPVGPGVRVLEFGAGGGWNLLAFQQAGATVTGVDHSPSLVEAGRRHGIAMRQGGFEAIEGEHDVIVLNHVFEHLIDPIGALGTLAGHLAPGGVLYVAVPDILHFDVSQFQNAHVWYFSPRTFAYYCRRAGLEVASMGDVQNLHLFGLFRRAAPASAADEPLSVLDGHYDEIAAMLTAADKKERVRGYLSRLGLEGPVKALYRLLR